MYSAAIVVPGNQPQLARATVPLWGRTHAGSLLEAHARVMRMRRETSSCEHETHQSLINNELMTVTDCRNCRETGETNCPEPRIHSLRFASRSKPGAEVKKICILMKYFFCFRSQWCCRCSDCGNTASCEKKHFFTTDNWWQPLRWFLYRVQLRSTDFPQLYPL